MPSRRLKVLLAISLLVNLFVIGAAGGAIVMWVGARHPTPRVRPVLAAAQVLPAGDQARYRAVIRDTLRQGQPYRIAARDNRRQAAALFVQPTFDAAAANAALARAREADFALREHLEQAVVAFSQTLPQSERAALAGGLARGGPLRHPKERAAR